MILLVRALAALAMLACCVAVATAQDMSTEDIVRALDPATGKQGLTRSFGRGVKVEKGDASPGPLAIDLYVNFAFDSDVLETDSLVVLDRLAAALADARLATFRFLVAGHTDAKGSAEYNQALSERRAASVVNYLVRAAKIDRTRLIDKGFGESELADPANPEGAVNRRVQIVNLTESAAK